MKRQGDLEKTCHWKGNGLQMLIVQTAHLMSRDAMRTLSLRVDVMNFDRDFVVLHEAIISRCSFVALNYLLQSIYCLLNSS